MQAIRKAGTTAAMAGVLLLAAGPALAHECVNASKQNIEAGVQLVLAGDFETLVWASPQVENRFANGTIDPDTGEGFHGQVGVDFDGDLVPEFVIWTAVGRDGAIPLQAQLRGAACAGIVNLEDYVSDCVSLLP